MRDNFGFGAWPRRAADVTKDLDGWVALEKEIAVERLLNNVSPPGAKPGAIVAAPSRERPDYYLHWVRDASIAVQAICALYNESTGQERQRYFDIILDFLTFSQHIQQTARAEGIGLGQPKFSVTGQPVNGRDALPQNDGPALRAIELAHFAFLLLDDGREDLVREKLYEPANPAASVIKGDLDYIANHWRDPCIGPWEEDWGHHFFTRVVQRKALTIGSLLAWRMKDREGARYYDEQAKLLSGPILGHWDPRRPYLVSILDGGARRRGLDAAVIFAALGGYVVHEVPPDELYPVNHDHTLATVVALERVFEALFPINDPFLGIPGIGIGRFPDDPWDGYSTDSVGNAWSCLTLAFAMYYYRLYEAYRSAQQLFITPVGLPFFVRLLGGSLRVHAGELLIGPDPRLDAILNALWAKGDSYLARVRFHANPDGTMSEGINWITGFQQGAPNLTMGYAVFILCALKRTSLLASREGTPRYTGT